MATLQVHTVVFLTTGHTDNESFLLKICRERPEHRIHCGLTPRIVDFSVRPYGTEFGAIQHAAKLERTFTPLAEIPTWISTIPDYLQQFFCVDAGASDKEVIDDSTINLQVCAMQFRAVLKAAGLDNCDFHWDQGSLHKIKLSQHHASQIPTFAYDFNDKERATYKAQSKEMPTGPERRELTRQFCHRYLLRKAKEFGIEDWEASSVMEFEDLVASHKQQHIEANVIVGDSFTEVCAYIKEVGAAEVFARSKAVSDYSEFYVPNLQDDSAFASEFVDLMNTLSIPLTIVPAEVVEDDVWELSRDELMYVCHKNTTLKAHLDRYKRDSRHPTLLYELPGLVMATIACCEDILPVKAVKLQVEVNSDGHKGIQIVEDPNGMVSMCYFPEDFNPGRVEWGRLLEKMHK